MFNIMGDTVEYDGNKVLVFRRDIGASLRDTVERAILDYKSVICWACGDENMPDDSDLKEQYEAMLRERNTFAALLGIPKK